MMMDDEEDKQPKPGRWSALWLHEHHFGQRGIEPSEAARKSSLSDPMVRSSVRRRLGLREPLAYFTVTVNGEQMESVGNERMAWYLAAKLAECGRDDDQYEIHAIKMEFVFWWDYLSAHLQRKLLNELAAQSAEGEISLVATLKGYELSGIKPFESDQ